eukprot:scaffold1882_cov181-Skeletonema_marinoi.AAC.14
MMKSISYNEVEPQLELEDVEAGENQPGNRKAAIRAKNIKSYILGICLVQLRMDTSSIATARKQHSFVSSPNDSSQTSLRLIDDALIMKG